MAGFKGVGDTWKKPMSKRIKLVSPPNPDALLPAEMAQKAEDVGIRKAGMGWVRTVMLGVLAGAFISLGANFSTVVLTGAIGVVPWGWARLVGGLAFSLGLGLVVVGGAELFTGNNLIIMAWASSKVKTRALLRNWGLVYIGNLLGALGTAALVFGSQQYLFSGGMVGKTMLDIALFKVQLGGFSLFCLGILCNALVCLAVWLSMSARSSLDRLAVIVLPVAAFVAGGFEHSVANMYFLPLAWLLRMGASEAFWSTIGKLPSDYSAITVLAILQNLCVVTLGNVVGGAVLVGLVYWAVYLRKESA